MLLAKTLKCMFLIKNLRVYTIGKSSAVFGAHFVRPSPKTRSSDDKMWKDRGRESAISGVAL